MLLNDQATGLKRLVILIAIVVTTLVISSFVPLTRNERVIIPNKEDHTTLTLSAGSSLSQTILVSPGLYSGVFLYADSPDLYHRHFSVKITDKSGKIISSGSNTFYRFKDDNLRLRLPTKWFKLKELTSVTFTIHLKDGPPLAVYLSERNSPNGELVYNQDVIPHETVLSLVERIPLRFGTRQGVFAGLLFLIGLYGIRYIKSEKKQWIAAGALLVVITPLALLGYWFSEAPLGIADWDYYFSLHHTYRQSILTHQQIPFWDPYICGGTAGFADPEFPGLTPTFLLEFLFGIPNGVRLAIYFATATGAVGMLILAKRLHLSLEGSLLAAIGVAFSTVNLLEITEGHVNVFAAMWIPWVLWAWVSAYKKPELIHRWRFICGIFLALTFFQGGIYLLMYTGFALLLTSLLLPRRIEAIVTTVCATLWAIGFAAIKLIPVIYWLRQFPDESFASSAYTLPWLVEILFGRHIHGAYLIFDQGDGWHEYGAYIGYFLFGLALIGVVHPRRRLVKILVMGALIVTLLSASGPALKPIFNYLWFFPRSNISRIILYAIIPLSLLAGLGLDKLRSRLSAQSFIITLLVGVVAVDLMSLAYPLSEQAFVLPRVYPAVKQAPYPIAFTTDRYDPQGQGNRTTRSYEAIIKGYGTLTYCSVLGPHPAIHTIADEDKGIYARAVDKEASVELMHWSPNYVQVRVKTPTATDVLINTNYAHGWTVNEKPVKNMDGLVSTWVEPGEHVLNLKYNPPGLWLGITITLVTLGFAFYKARKKEL